MYSEYPEQGEFHDLLANKTTEAEHSALVAEMRRRGKGGLDELFQSTDIVVALADSPLCMYSSAAGEFLLLGCIQSAVRVACGPWPFVRIKS